MIRVVISVGTDHHPFDRLIDWICAVQDRLSLDVFLQRGATSDRSGLRSADYLAPQALEEVMREADVVVCHGGPGTIALARRAGHRPIVVPRDPTLGEHVDDHQLRYASQLASEGIIDMATSIEDLARLISQPRQRLAANEGAADIRRAVEQFSALVAGLLDGNLPKRRLRDRFLVGRTR